MCMQDLATEALSVLYLPIFNFEGGKKGERKGGREKGREGKREGEREIERENTFCNYSCMVGEGWPHLLSHQKKLIILTLQVL